MGAKKVQGNQTLTQQLDIPCLVLDIPCLVLDIPCLVLDIPCLVLDIPCLVLDIPCLGARMCERLGEKTLEKHIKTAIISIV
jgi:hypothetical protein